ncbi:MAG: preprotein translocase subunit SecG [Nannocystaceae bacterium]
MFEILVTTITIVFVGISFLMVLLILLQSGKGGMGAALGGGASQSVFGGGGSADVLSKGTQYLAASFMICAIFLAYAGSHSGSSRLEGLSEDIEQKSGLFDSNEEINFEAIGNLPLPESGEQVKEQEAPPVVESQLPADVIPSEPDPVEGSGEAAGLDAIGTPTDAAAGDAAPAGDAPAPAGDAPAAAPVADAQPAADAKPTPTP